MPRLSKELTEKFFTSSGEIKPGFSGIGKLRGTTIYTKEEETVLNHFFTNTHSNIYCAKDTMPNELWALLMGQYARSDKTARDRFVELLKAMPKKNSEVPTLEALADIIENEGKVTEALKTHLKTAGKFIEIYGIDYGHASLRDSGTIRICFEGVSQRATKFLEAAREGAYQEQSTRAIPFSKENLGIPFEIRNTQYEKRMLELDEKLISLYDSIRKALPEKLKEDNKRLKLEADVEVEKALERQGAKLPDSSWNKVIEAKTFDIARSLLPQNMTTSLGITLNTRRFQDVLTEWQSLPFIEMQLLGRAAQIESMKISPTLMKYGNPSNFYQELPAKRRELNEEFAPSNKNFPYQHYPIESKLIAHTPNLEDWVLASILLNGSNGTRPLTELNGIIEKLSSQDKAKIARTEIEGKKSHEIYPKTMEIGSVTFERFYDIGAYRDLHRQRGDRQQINPYSVIGYHIPKELNGTEFERPFKELMNGVKELYDSLKTDGLHEAAEYIPVMANMLRHIVTEDPVQAFYVAGLRTQPAGADSYRSIARSETRQILGLMPSFKGVVAFDDNEYPLNRLPETIRGYIANEKKK